MISITNIADKINGHFEGNPDLLIEDICELKGGVKNCISFITHPKYIDLYIESNATAVIASMTMDLPESSKMLIRVDNPSLAFNAQGNHLKVDNLLKKYGHTSISQDSVKENRCLHTMSFFHHL